MQLKLTDQEASLLLRVVRNRLGELRIEVRHDHGTESRAYLLHKERLLKRILDKFPEINEYAHMEGFEIGAVTTLV
ncbi:MAG: hypothetical protein PVG53_12390 [Holophagae bacterium]|jgi:hypothetical protein